MSIDRRQSLKVFLCAGLAAVLAGSFAGLAFASDDSSAAQPFTEAAFDAAQKAGKPILIDTFATWCPICSRQAPVLEKLHAEPKFSKVLIFKVNFDTQKDVMRKFHATVQSTLIAFNGTKEVGRSIGETQPEWIEDLFEKTIDHQTS